MKDKTTTALLALFLGGLGVHKFYLERYVQGVLYLLFSCTLIPFILGVVEFFIYITMSDYDFDLKYNCQYGNIRKEDKNLNIEYLSLYNPTTTEPVSFKEALSRMELASTNESRDRQKKMLIEMDKILKGHRCSIHNKPVKYGYSFEFNKMGIELLAKCCEESKEELMLKL